MKLFQLPRRDLRRKLAGPGVWIRTGPFSFKVQSSIPSVAQGLAELYGQFEVRSEHETSANFHVVVNSRINLRRWPRRQAEFSLNGVQPFQPLPHDQAFSMLECGLNWGISTQTQQYLILPAAVVEKNGLAAILIAPMGAGKSTLTAALVLSGWRLLSDEFTLINRNNGLIQPIPRPIILKNESIPIIREFSKDAFINRISYDSFKNTVAHMRPPSESVRRQHESARAGWLIFPQWSAQAQGSAHLTPRPESETLRFFDEHLFTGPDSHKDMVPFAKQRIKTIPGFDFIYSQLDQAIEVFNQLAENSSPHLHCLSAQDAGLLTHRHQAV